MLMGTLTAITKVWDGNVHAILGGGGEVLNTWKPFLAFWDVFNKQD